MHFQLLIFSKWPTHQGSYSSTLKNTREQVSSIWTHYKTFLLRRSYCLPRIHQKRERYSRLSDLHAGSDLHAFTHAVPYAWKTLPSVSVWLLYMLQNSTILGVLPLTFICSSWPPCQLSSHWNLIAYFTSVNFPSSYPGTRLHRLCTPFLAQCPAHTGGAICLQVTPKQMDKSSGSIAAQLFQFS